MYIGKEIDKLKAQLEIALTALKLYADEERWDLHSWEWYSDDHNAPTEAAKLALDDIDEYENSVTY